MLVYHGSNRNFRKLRIAKELVRHKSSLENEGLGIYFSTDKSVAMSYGKYLYAIEIDNSYLVDFRRLSNCNSYVNRIVKEIYKKNGINISKYIDKRKVAESMYYGVIPISGVGREIYMLLDSESEWFNNSVTKIKQVYSTLKSIDKSWLKAYMFNYHIKNTGVIKKLDEDMVKIVGKEIMK